MTLRHRLLALTAAAAALALPLTAQAHRGWILPTFTVVSGDDPWVAVDAAVSNELFYPDHNPMRLDGLKVYAPDGSLIAPENALTGKYRSTFDLHLTKPGTYKLAVANSSVTASWTEAGQVKRWRGAPDAFVKEVPAGAADLKVQRSASRNESFITRGAPTATVLQPTGAGLELVPITHPNDLVATEAASFKFLLDGKPAADLEVTIIPGASRYRASPGEIKVKTGPDGVFKVTLPEAGMYWMNATVRSGVTGRGPGPAPGAPPMAGMGGPGGGQTAPLAGDGASASYTATIEALRP
ncbi:MAG: hypothetical protein JWP92_2824 [Caulobacter sp.]|nr:hypothetical protein [Caulobacter sp.]